MKVLHVLGAGERGGAETALETLLRHSAEHDVVPVVAALARGAFLDELAGAGIDVVTLADAPRTREVWRLPAAARAVARVASVEGCDLVQANGERMGILSALAARRIGVPSVVWLHDAPARNPSARGIQLALRALRPDAFVAPSQWMTEVFEAELHRPVTHIPHGIDVERLRAPAADLRTEAGWAAGTVVVSHIGRLQRWKGADVFLRAVARAAPEAPALRAAVVGGALYGWEDEYGRGLPALAAELGIADLVHFTGHRDDAGSVMAASDVVVHSSVQDEPLGLVVPEAMALGRCVVASRTRGPEEVVRDGVSGLLVARGDFAALAAALVQTTNDPDLRERLGRQAAIDVTEQRSATAMAGAFALLYQEVARR